MTEPHDEASASSHSHGSKPRSRGPELRRLAVWLVVLSGVFAAIAFVAYRWELQIGRRVAAGSGRRAIDLGSEILQRELAAVRADARFLAEQATLTDFLQGRDGARARLEREYRSFARHQGLYDQIRVLDTEGAEIVRINNEDGRPIVVRGTDLQRKSDRDYFRRGIRLERGEVATSRFDLNVERGEIERPLKPVIRFTTPVHDEERLRGVLVLNYLGAAMLDKLAEVGGEFEGALTLVDREGAYLFNPREPGTEWGALLGSPAVTLAGTQPRTWSRIESEQAGTLLEPDGQFVFRWIPLAEAGSGDLCLVAHLSREELAAGADALLRRILAVYAGLAPVVIGLAALLAWAGATRRRHEQRIVDSERRLRALSSQLLGAQEAERARLSRDLHDDLGQLVTSVALDLDRAAETDDASKRTAALDHARSANRLLLDHIRGISARLRPRILDDLGLSQAVRELAAEWARRTGVRLELDLSLNPDRPLPGDVRDHVYRIVQEALTNVGRHAQARRVDLAVRRTGDGVEVEVQDDGAGFDPDGLTGEGLGLLGMRERAELVGGTFSLTASPGRGTEIRVRIPLNVGVA